MLYCQFITRFLEAWAARLIYRSRSLSSFSRHLALLVLRLGSFISATSDLRLFKPRALSLAFIVEVVAARPRSRRVRPESPTAKAAN